MTLDLVQNDYIYVHSPQFRIIDTFVLKYIDFSVNFFPLVPPMDFFHPMVPKKTFFLAQLTLFSEMYGICFSNFSFRNFLSPFSTPNIKILADVKKTSLLYVVKC